MNIPGYGIGGPVMIPKVLDRGKLFFFLSQEFTDDLRPSDVTRVNYPTALERQGDFSQTYFGNANGPGQGTLLQIINTRADLLGATRVIDAISLDKYTFIRDAYLQRRRSLVFDGDVPETPETPAAPDESASAPAGSAVGNVAPPTAATPASAPTPAAPASTPR